MSKEKRKRELEREIEELRRKLNRLTEKIEEEEEDDSPPYSRRSGRRSRLPDDDPMKDFDPFKSSPPDPPHPSQPPKPPKPAKTPDKVQKARLKAEKERIKTELRKLKGDLREREKDLRQRQRELRERAREIREKEREFRHKSRDWDVALDEDIEGITGDLEIRLGDFTRSILSSVAESLKTSMGLTLSGATGVGKELGNIGKEIKKISKEMENEFRIGPKIPEEKMEEFYEKGAEIVSSIGDPNRLRLLKELEKGPKYQKELSDLTKLRGGTFKHHMDKLLDESVKFVTQEVVRGRYLLTTRGREALKLAEILYMRYLEGLTRGPNISVKEKNQAKKKVRVIDRLSEEAEDVDEDEDEFNVKIR